MSDAFLSYSRSDIAIALHIYTKLIEAGYNIWFDKTSIDYTAKWWKSIQEGITSANNFIFIITQNSLKSEVCTCEFARAVSSGKRIVPILYTKPDLNEALKHLVTIVPSNVLMQFLDGRELTALLKQNWAVIAETNWIDFQQEENFDKAADDLIKTIKTDLEYKNAHTRLEVRAQDWKDHHEQIGLLLYDEALKEAQNWLKESQANRKNPPPTPLQERYILASVEHEKHLKEEEAQLKQRELRLTRRQLLGLRYVGAALGSGFGFGLIIYSLFNSGSGSLSPQQVTSSIALAAIFGILTGFVLLIATEFHIELPKPVTKLGDFLPTWIVSTILCIVVFILYRRMKLQEIPNPVWLVISACLFTAGFSLAPLVTRNVWLRIIAGICGIFLAFYLPWQLNHEHAVINFGVSSNSNPALFLSLVFAITTGILTFLPELYGETSTPVHK